jgi:hypothetical protein
MLVKCGIERYEKVERLSEYETFGKIFDSIASMVYLVY